MRGYQQSKNTVSARIINIATLAVTLGIATILIALVCSKGLQQEIQNKTSVFNGPILVTLFENNESQISVNPFLDTEEIRAHFQKEENILRFHPIAIKAGMLRTSADFEGVLLKGVSTDFDWSGITPFLTRGRFPNLSGGLSNEILLSETLARQLDLKLGDQTEAFFQREHEAGLPLRRRFTVVGVFSSGFPDIDQTLVYGDLRQVQRLNGWDSNSIGAFEVYIKNYEHLEQTAERLYAVLPSDLNSIPISQRFSSIYQWIALFDFNVLIILVVMLLVGVINMATALLVLILERSRMVGLLKTLGAGNALIQKIFLYNGVAIMSKGLLFGNLIGLGFYFSQKYWGWIRLDPATYFVDIAPVSLSFTELLVLNLFFLLISSLLLWLPSKIILKISPAKVLRFR